MYTYARGVTYWTHIVFTHLAYVYMKYRGIELEAFHSHGAHIEHILMCLICIQ